jgi:hypothetical protein
MALAALAAAAAAGAVAFNIVGVAAASPGRHHPSTVLGASLVSGGKELGMEVVAAQTFSSTTGGTYVPLPGASLSWSVPSTITETIVITFSGASVCQGGTGLGSCGVRPYIDGSPLAPTGWQADGTSTSAFGYTSLTYTWATTVGGGGHNLAIYYDGANIGETMALNNWTLELVAYNAHT